MSNPAEHPFDLLASIDQRSRARSTSPELEQPEGMVGRLALRFSDQRIMVSMEEISQIIPAPVITRVPGVKPWLMGIANLRGTVLSVINLGGFLANKSSSITKSSRIVTVNSGDWFFGLLIDEVIGMRHFTEHSLVPEAAAAEVVDPQLKPYITEVYNSEDQHWMAFDIGALLNNAYFLDAAA